LTALPTGMLPSMETRRMGSRRHLATSPFAPPSQPSQGEAFTERDRVSHDRYGLGRIVRVEGATAVIVDFGDARVRVQAPFVKLTKL
jgi:hypothetical protein